MLVIEFAMQWICANSKRAWYNQLALLLMRKQTVPSAHFFISVARTRRLRQSQNDEEL